MDVMQQAIDGWHTQASVPSTSLGSLRRGGDRCTSVNAYSDRSHPYSEEQLAGLRAHAQAQKQSTIDRLRAAITSLQEQQHAALLQDYVQKDIRIAELEAELARYRQYLEGLRLAIQQQEHGG